MKNVSHLEIFFPISCEGTVFLHKFGTQCKLSEFFIQVTPAAGIVKPDQVADISIHHLESHTLEESVDGIPQSWWSEDTRDKEIVLLVNVIGTCSTDTKTHRIHVRHSFSGNPVRADSRNNASRKHGGSSHSRSSRRHSGNAASDMG